MILIVDFKIWYGVELMTHVLQYIRLRLHMIHDARSLFDDDWWLLSPQKGWQLWSLSQKTSVVEPLICPAANSSDENEAEDGEHHNDDHDDDDNADE